MKRRYNKKWVVLSANDETGQLIIRWRKDAKRRAYYSGELMSTTLSSERLSIVTKIGGLTTVTGYNIADLERVDNDDA